MISPRVSATHDTSGLDTTLCVPATQNEPAGHAPTHCDVSWLIWSPYWPLAQGWASLVPLGQKEPNGQGKQPCSEARPVSGPREPALHGVGWTVPTKEQ